MPHSSDQNERLCTLALFHTPGVGAVTIRQLISYCGSASNVFHSDYKRLIKIPGIGGKVVREILKKDLMGFAERELKECEKAEIRLHFYYDKSYPARLKALYDAPVVLYSQGHFDYNAARTVGIVGTRQISDYGKSVTETIIKDLMPYHVMVISGLAYGVDITAHRACLRHEIPTVGVMAGGLYAIYPSVHKRTARDMMAAGGGLVTENALAVKPDFMRFPARNRIIAGLSDVTIVVESARKGGSLITAEFAQNYHREVFAVPGLIGASMSEGCNQLIRDQKAVIFTSVNDMADSLRWVVGDSDSVISAAGELPISFDGFTQDEGQVLSMLRTNGPMQLDELAWQSGIHLNRLANLLLSLEFQGIIRALPGKKYALM